MKKVIISLSIIAVVAVIVIGATGAFFSDTETSTGNTFTAGELDLKIDDQCSYNGEIVEACTWELKNLDENDVFFNYDDIKPGDYGENTISLHVQNPAWVCAEIMNLQDKDNSCNDPELESEPDCALDDDGELAKNLVFTIWNDNGIGEGHACNNLLDDDEIVMVDAEPAIAGLWPIADSTTGTGPVPADVTTCIGVAWSLPSIVGNEVQTDSLAGDIRFTAIQERHNDSFICGENRPPVETRNISLENKDDGWQILSDDQTYGDFEYSHNDTTFRGVVTGTGLVPNGKYQITLNGPKTGLEVGCSFTNLSLGNFVDNNAFQGGFWDSEQPNLSLICTTDDEEGLYNMNLVGDHYTFIAGPTGAFNHSFNLSLPSGDYHDVKILVKKMLDLHASPWADTGTGYPAFNLYETAAISFTVLP